METLPVTIARDQAKQLYRNYKRHLHYSQPIDRECMRAYQLIAQGRLIIRALESIEAAGLGDKGLPKLAIARADEKVCECRVGTDGSARLNGQGATLYYNDRKHSSRVFNFRRRTFAGRQWLNGNALVPTVPLHLRPARGLPNYHILWEADWTMNPPGDPFLLRRIGKADMWLVVAQWDLTEVERAALRTRLANA